MPRRTGAPVRQRIVDGRPEPHASWAIEWRNRPGLIGLCALGPSQERGFTEISWRLAYRYWNKGIATEAASAVTKRALGHLGITPLLALINPENLASIRVAEKIGYRAGGEAQFRGVRQLVYRIDAEPH
jgi:[ribosomal protein S5]-alanine N-acetyltransferase